MLASFEKTADHLFDAAYFGQKDSVCGKLLLRLHTRNRMSPRGSVVPLTFPVFLFQVCLSASSWGFQWTSEQDCSNCCTRLTESALQSKGLSSSTVQTSIYLWSHSITGENSRKVSVIKKTNKWHILSRYASACKLVMQFSVWGFSRKGDCVFLWDKRLNFILQSQETVTYLRVINALKSYSCFPALMAQITLCKNMVINRCVADLRMITS